MEQQRVCPVCANWRWRADDTPDVEGHHPDCGVNLRRLKRLLAERTDGPWAREGKQAMAAYLVGHITVRDLALWSQYTAGVRESLQPFGAEVVFRGRRASLLAGALDGEQVVVLRFADHETLQQWFRSPAYQMLIPLREKAATVVLASYQEEG